VIGSAGEGGGGVVGWLAVFSAGNGLNTRSSRSGTRLSLSIGTALKLLLFRVRGNRIPAAASTV